MDLLAGPRVAGGFATGDTISCDYVQRDLSGNSPKFACRLASGDELKVKFGGTNGEVYGEVLATRLLWALGFGADRMYPVSVICRRCPRELGGILRPGNESRFAPAVVERKMDGREWSDESGPGWSWEELDETSGPGASRAHRDAFKLLAVLIQHTDSKKVQQRILCPESGSARDAACRRPFLMISDLGLTFGRANRYNLNDAGGVNLAAWAETPMWRESPACEGNLPKSVTGTLDNPVISEAGRAFLARLLVQLSDRQLRDLFRAGQVTLRLREPGRAKSEFGTVEEWVQAFKAKRRQIVERRCA